MKRFFTVAAAALLSSVFATSTFAAWGTGGWGVPVGPPVGQSSTPSTNPASAPITTPFNPNSDLGAVPGSYKDPKMQATHSKAWQAQQYAKAKANFDKKQYSPRLAPQNLQTPMSVPMNQRPSMNMNTNADAAARYNMGRYGTKYGTYEPNKNTQPNLSDWQQYNNGRYGSPYGTYDPNLSKQKSGSFTPPRQRPMPSFGTYGGSSASQFGMFAR